MHHDHLNLLAETDVISTQMTLLLTVMQNMVDHVDIQWPDGAG